MAHRKLPISSCIYRQVFFHAGKPALFEVGYVFPSKGCDFVFNSQDRRLEQIYATEEGYAEGVRYMRVETLADVWYDVDGLTTFGRKIAECDVDHEPDESALLMGEAPHSDVGLPGDFAP